MTWFLMAIMSITHLGGEIDTFIWTKPTFKSSEECIQWVKDNNQPIYFTLKEKFPNDKLDKLFCVQEDKLKRFLEMNEQAKKGSKS